MAELVADCPRCGAAHITFDCTATNRTRVEYGWLQWFEAFCVCRKCHKGTVFVIRQLDIVWKDRTEDPARPAIYRGVLNDFFEPERYLSIADQNVTDAPEYTPPEIAKIFREASSSLAVGNFNASGAMFRLAINLATKPLLPEPDVPGLTRRKRRDLGPRIEWLMQNGMITQDLFDLSECIREDGNDGAHDGTLERGDAEGLLDFSTALFERLYTEPGRLRIAKERREKRRALISGLES